MDKVTVAKPALNKKELLEYHPTLHNLLHELYLAKRDAASHSLHFMHTQKKLMLQHKACEDYLQDRVNLLNVMIQEHLTEIVEAERPTYVIGISRT